MVKVAINGLGRIGRSVLKIALDKKVDIVAVNDLTDIKTIVYLLKYDSVFGKYEKDVEAGKDFIKIDKKIKFPLENLDYGIKKYTEPTEYIDINDAIKNLKIDLLVVKKNQLLISTLAVLD